MSEHEHPLGQRDLVGELYRVGQVQQALVADEAAVAPRPLFCACSMTRMGTPE